MLVSVTVAGCRRRIRDERWPASISPARFHVSPAKDVSINAMSLDAQREGRVETDASVTGRLGPVTPLAPTVHALRASLTGSRHRPVRIAP